MSGIGLPKGMSRDDAYVQGIADTEERMRTLIPDMVVKELAGCEQGGIHVVTTNEHYDAWCANCGERLLLPGFAGATTDYSGVA